MSNEGNSKAIGYFRFNHKEQLMSAKERCEMFDRDNRVTADDVVAALRRFMNGEGDDEIRRLTEANKHANIQEMLKWVQENK